jgi:ABC-2 type transport system permease protein
MTLLATERIKLFTTRSPWWSMALAVVLVVGFTAVIFANTTDGAATVTDAEADYRFGLVVMMVMAALAVTTEYRFGTIRASFQAVPNRTALLLAKTTVVALLAAVVGEIASFGSWAVARAIRPGAQLALDSAQAWRNVAGLGLVYFLTAVLAVAVGLLVRHTAGAVAILLIYALLAENLIGVIPKIGPNIQRWMPFTEANNFLTATRSGEAMGPIAHMPFGPWGSLAYFAGLAVVVLGIALVAVNRRDA